MAEVRRGKSMRSFRKGWLLISPTGRVVYPAELVRTERTGPRSGQRRAIFLWRPKTKRPARPKGFTPYRAKSKRGRAAGRREKP
jgi:hypothetical protein